jgi:7-cyano-7-deazaguanine reductase
VLHCREFTCRCPITGQPDWAEITISYRPNARIVESKSVKLYLETFREEGIFHEHLATTIRDDFVAALDPRSLDVPSCSSSVAAWPSTRPARTRPRATGSSLGRLERDLREPPPGDREQRDRDERHPQLSDDPATAEPGAGQAVVPAWRT